MICLIKVILITSNENCFRNERHQYTVYNVKKLCCQIVIAHVVLRYIYYVLVIQVNYCHMTCINNGSKVSVQLLSGPSRVCLCLSRHDAIATIKLETAMKFNRVVQQFVHYL